MWASLARVQGRRTLAKPIDAVVFLVPGTITAKAPFDFTIVGFAPGTSAADAPGKIAACGTTTGTVAPPRNCLARLP